MSEETRTWAYPPTIKIKRHHPDLIMPEYKPGSDWIDLRAAENVDFHKGDLVRISLGISIKLPDGYGTILAPRSSTARRFGIILANSIGIIDNSYCGDDDIICFEAYCIRDGFVEFNDRICQMTIYEHPDRFPIEEVTKMNAENRGGFGSTGVK